ncbi:MAG: putative Se/S carrier-like protein [Oscillospiraceae bacterium]
MPTYEIIVGTLTYTMKAEKLLTQARVSVYVQKDPYAAQKGCGYILIVTTKNIEGVKALIQNNNIPIKSIQKRRN